MKLYLDDVRKAPEGWVPVRNMRDAIHLLRGFEIKEMSFDHDLGDLEPTGLDILNWIEREVFVGNIQPPKRMYVHSMNPVGRDSMFRAIEQIEHIVKERPVQEIIDLMHLSGVGIQEVEDLKILLRR